MTVQPVRAYPDLLQGIAGPVYEFSRPDNATLADLVALVPLKSEVLRSHLRVKMNGELIAPELYGRIKPKDRTYVSILLPVHGGGDSNGAKILGTVAAIALIGASIFVGGFGLPFLGAAFGAGTIGAQLVAGGLSLAASLLLQGLQPQASGAGQQSQAKQVGYASAQNTFEPGAYLPRVIGTRRIAPPIVMPPYTEVQGPDQFVTVVYGLAGPHQLEAIQIGETEIAGATDVEYETRTGTAADAALTLVDDTIIEDGINLQLSTFRTKENGYELDPVISPNTPQWHRIETRRDPGRFGINLVFPGGFGGTGGVEETFTAVRLRMRRKGTVTWTNLPEFLIYGKTVGTALRLRLEFRFRSPVAMPPAGDITPEPGLTGNSGWRYYYTSVTPPTGPAWNADAYFSGTVVNWVDAQTYHVYLNTDSFPVDAYEFEIIRGFTIKFGDFDVATHVMTATAQSERDDFFQAATDGATLEVAADQNDFVQTLTISSVQSMWNEYPFDFTGHPTALIAVRARSRSVEQLTVLATGLADDYDEGTGTWVALQPTRNPASWYREVLRGNLNAEPVPDTLIDEANLADWHGWCADNGYTVDAEVRGQPVTEVLSIIAQAGFARPRYSATHGVIIDRARTPVGLVTQRNASGFSFQKPFSRLPHALRVNLADEANDYEVRELTVYDTGYNDDGSGGLIEASRFESITYPGITAEAQATARATRDLLFARHRSRLINFTMDIEHLEFQLGDLVLLETDILGTMSGRGRAKAILTDGSLITGLVLDENVKGIGASASSMLTHLGEVVTHLGEPITVLGAAAEEVVTGAIIRLSDGTVRVEEISVPNAALDTILFATPFAMPTSGGFDLIEVGTLVATGQLGSEAREVLIWDIVPGPDLTAQITAIDYAGDIFYP